MGVAEVAQVARAGKAALDIGKKYGKGIGKALLTKRGRSKVVSGAAAFKKKKLASKARIIGRGLKKGSSKALSDLDKLGEIAGAAGAATGHEGLQGVSAKLKGAAQEGRKHRAAAQEAIKQTKTTWANAIAAHNPPTV